MRSDASARLSARPSVSRSVPHPHWQPRPQLPKQQHHHHHHQRRQPQQQPQQHQQQHQQPSHPNRRLQRPPSLQASHKRKSQSLALLASLRRRRPSCAEMLRLALPLRQPRLWMPPGPMLRLVNRRGTHRAPPPRPGATLRRAAAALRLSSLSRMVRFGMRPGLATRPTRWRWQGLARLIQDPSPCRWPMRPGPCGCCLTPPQR